tara:strand:+ start:347 stop:832 length:486 start_codon:yes stop_codon:yes gene_type:complete
MASILKVDTIQHTNGTEALTIDTSGRIKQPQIPAACFHYQGGNLAGAAIVPLNTQSVLQGGMTMSSNAITVPVTGLYSIGWHHLANGTSANAVFFIRINGAHNSDLPHGWATQFRPSHSNNNFSAQTIASLSANDTVDFYVSSGSIHGNADYNSMFVYLLG